MMRNWQNQMNVKWLHFNKPIVYLPHYGARLMYEEVHLSYQFIISSQISLVVLLSVDPVSAIWMASAQMTSQVLIDNLGMAVEELTTLYGKMGIGGTYLSTKELDDTHWIVTLNNYYLIYRFSVEIDSGDIKLLTIKTRNF